MKATQAAPTRAEASDEASSQLWNMQAATPLFGTAYDQALLTTPLKLEPAQSMDSMTLPSQTPNGRRWWPFLLAASAGLALAGAGIWVFGISSGSSSVRAAMPNAEHGSVIAQPLPDAPGGGEPSVGEGQKPPAAEAAGPSTALTAAVEPSLGEPANGKPEPGQPVAEAGGSSGTEATPAKGGEPAAAGAGAPVEAARANAPSSTKSSAMPDAEKAGKERTIKKPTARVEKPSAIPELGASVFGFDKAAAKAALNMAADAATSCGAGGAPGKGKIQVTFAPTGKVSDAQIVEGPFVGTTAGKCALRQFKAAKVPAFSGAPVTVAKSFRVD